MNRFLFFFLLPFIGGCSYFKSPVILQDGTQLSQKAYIQTKQFEAETACHNSRKLDMPDNPTSEQVLAFALASLALQNLDSCRGTNTNDVAIARVRSGWGFAGIVARVIGQSYDRRIETDFCFRLK